MSERFGTPKKSPKKKKKSSKKKETRWYEDYPEFFEEDTEEIEELDELIVEGRDILKEIRRKMGRKPEHWASQAFTCPIRMLNDWRGVEHTNSEGLTT